MRDRLLLCTIGLLAGIVVMQWTMPAGIASVATPAGGVVAAFEDEVLMVDGSIWDTVGVEGGIEWRKLAQLPIPVDQVAFYCGSTLFVDQNGDMWGWGGPGPSWLNFGHPPISTNATEQSTWGKVKGMFSGKDSKP